MRTIGLDPAKTIGWSIIEDGKLIDYGKIQCSDLFSLPQRLNYYHIEITRLIDKYKPDNMAIEDLIMGISGVKVLCLLARINGVAIHAGFSGLKDNVKLYKPSEWKQDSIPNIIGNSPKWKIQLEVCRYFNIKINGDYSIYDKWESECNKRLEKLHSEIETVKTEIESLKKDISRKRNPPTAIERIDLTNKIAQLSKQYSALKTQMNKLKKSVDKELSKIGTDIDSQTGISSDIADSMCIAVCLQKQISNV